MSEIKTTVDVIKGTSTQPTVVVSAQAKGVGVTTIIPCKSLAEYDEMLEALQSLRADVALKFAGKPIKEYTGRAVFKNGLFYTDTTGNVTFIDGSIVEIQGVAPQHLSEIGKWKNREVYRGMADIQAEAEEEMLEKYKDTDDCGMTKVRARYGDGPGGLGADDDIDKKTLGDIEELKELKAQLERKPTLGEAMGNILKNR
jgi:hypothetical protein